MPTVDASKVVNFFEPRIHTDETLIMLVKKCSNLLFLTYKISTKLQIADTDSLIFKPYLSASISANGWLNRFLLRFRSAVRPLAQRIIAGRCRCHRAHLCNSGTLPWVCRLSWEFFSSSPETLCDLPALDHPGWDLCSCSTPHSSG